MKEYIRSIILQNNIKIQNEWSIFNNWITEYHNEIIDTLILSGALYAIDMDQINNDILSILYPQVLKKYQKIVKSSLVSNTYTNKILLEEIAKSITLMSTSIYLDRFITNIEAVDKILKEIQLDTVKFEKIAKSSFKLSRLEILQKAAKTGTNWKGEAYSYKQLKNLNKGINKYIENRSLQDKYELNYNESLSNGETPFKSKKTWVWSGLENTRHWGMDGVTVSLKEPFEVMNGITKDIDYLMFPGDFNNDKNNCSNICNCRCSILYI